MSTLSEFDEASLAVIQSAEFQYNAIGFLRKVERFGDTAIRVSSDEHLKTLAQKFCFRHLDKIFPDIRRTGVPDAHLVYREVFKIYKELKTELLDQIRLKRVLLPICVSEPIMPPELYRPCSPSSTTTYTSLTTTSSASTKRSKRRIRPARRVRRIRGRQRIASNSTPSTTDSDQGPPDSFESPKPVDHEPSDKTLSTQKVNSDNEDAVCELPDNQCLAHDATAGAYGQDTLVEELMEQNQRLQITNQHLEHENRILMDYRNFVHYTLRVCQDTWLEEGKSARAARIIQSARECERIVEAFRDVLSDIDFKYFHDYHRLHKRAPPSRYWLDSVRSQRQRLR